jgi:hypothetical protein
VARTAGPWLPVTLRLAGQQHRDMMPVTAVPAGRRRGGLAVTVDKSESNSVKLSESHGPRATGAPQCNPPAAPPRLT